MAAPLAAAAGKLLARRAAIGAIAGRRGGGAPGRIAAVIIAILLLPALIVAVIVGGGQPLCGPSGDDGEIPGTYDGPGSLGGVLGTGVSPAELRGARAHPLGGTSVTAGPYRTTAYAPVAGGVNCGNGCAATASGIRVDSGRRKAYLIASNPKLNKYGAMAYIWPNPYGWRGPFVVADTGGDFGGAGRLDFYTFEPGSLARALRWGNTKMAKLSSEPIVSGGPTAETGPPSTSDPQPGASPAPGGSTKMVRPTSGPFTSPFGMRWGRLHAGVDIAPPEGTPIVAPLAGVVVLKGFVSGYGNFTCIRHNPNLSTCYGHQQRWANGVRQGAPVTQGQTIGYVGNTGHSTGPHLHFEVRRGPGFSGTPVDPAPFLNGAASVDASADTPGPGSAECAATPIGDQSAAGNTPVKDGTYAWPAGSAGGQGRGKVIGFPGQGTHSFSAPPNNWQSDNAIDLAVPVGTPLVAVDDGTISRRLGFGLLEGGTASRFAGIRLHLEDAHGNTWYYAHLSRVSVKPGDRVKRGQVIGASGSANGVAHLHLGVEKQDPTTLLGIGK